MLCSWACVVLDALLILRTADRHLHCQDRLSIPDLGWGWGKHSGEWIGVVFAPTLQVVQPPKRSLAPTHDSFLQQDFVTGTLKI